MIKKAQILNRPGIESSFHPLYKVHVQWAEPEIANVPQAQIHLLENKLSTHWVENFIKICFFGHPVYKKKNNDQSKKRL
mgnify:CR=1 FL=1